MIETIKQQIEETSINFAKLEQSYIVIEKITEECLRSLQAGGKILWCGNGGSASQSQHLAAELVGRFAFDRPPMASLALTVDTSALTAIGNDYGFNAVFERQLHGIGHKGDILIGLSTSGNSENVIRAFLAAHEIGIKTIAFTGERQSKLDTLADISFKAPATASARIQEIHLAVGHIICGLIEKALYSGTKNYKPEKST